MVNRRSTSNSSGFEASDDAQNHHTYEEIMGEEGGHQALSSRLVSFRKWVQHAGCKVHPAVCIVNGEATDGTRNAPVLILGPPPSLNSSKPVSNAEGRRCGLVDTDEDRVLYDRTIGCQIRTAREMKEGQVMMSVPRSIMIHPDLIAASDAGRVALACCEPLEYGANFWDAFGNTAEKEKTLMDKISSSGGTQLLVKILQERKKVETALSKAAKAVEDGSTAPSEYKLAPKGLISTRAGVLLFLIQQRFADDLEPRVSSGYDFGQWSTKDDAEKSVERIEPQPGTPDTFSPYARTLPPSVPLPMCWKRNELAVLASCIPGTVVLQEVAAQILALSSDLIALIDAGIFHRFPFLFSHKLLTWDRWLWAASVHMSRMLSAGCYLNKGEKKAANHVIGPSEVFYSPPDVWDELGVMVPLIDMLNHEVEESQIEWDSPFLPNDDDAEMPENGNEDGTVATVVIRKRVKKGSQIYTNYGFDNNKELMLRYGFAQMANHADTVSIGWALNDSVGNVSKPNDYTPISKTEEDEENGKEDSRGVVYESSEPDAINRWWTEDRLSVLESEIKSDPSFWNSVRKGKKITASALSDGTYHPILLTIMTVATMSPWAIQKHTENLSSSGSEKPKIAMTKRHLRVLRNYMLFFFTRKLERLLQNFSNGLKAHFNNINLWTKSTEGGLDYRNDAEGMDTSENASNYTGWNSFFDSFAYTAAMEVETRYYSLAPDSCVLTLYDGNLRALQASIDGVVSEAAFKENVAALLEDLGFAISDEDEKELEEEVVVVEPSQGDIMDQDDKKQTGNNKSDGQESQKKQENGAGGGEKKKRNRNRNRNKQGGGGGPAVKIHIGNLSYQTVPTRLHDFFANRYGKESVLECHIPTERETGKSRGFGFVTMPESVAMRILGENMPHEIDGRVIKLAESNTSVQARGSGSQNGGAVNTPSDRCGNCGYRATYCSCQTPNMPGFQHHGSPPRGPPGHNMRPPDDIYGPGPVHPGQMDYARGGPPPEHDPRGGRRRSRSLNRVRSRSRSPSPRSRRRDGSRDRHYERSHRDRRGRSYSRSRSRSYSRSSRDRKDRRGERDRDWDREGGRSGRSGRASSRRSSRYSRSRSRSLSRSRSPNYPKDAAISASRRDRERERKSSGGGSNADTLNAQSRGTRSRSRSQSIAPQERDAEIDSNKREGGKSSRRARSKSRDRTPRSRKRSSKGSRRNKETSKRHSRSRSRDF